MDKKSIIGLLIIAGILVLFSILNPAQEPKEETTEENTVENDSSQVEEIEIVEGDSTTASPLVAKVDDEGQFIFDSLNGQVYTDTITGLDTTIAATTTEVKTQEVVAAPIFEGEEKLITLENDVMIIDVTNHGGKIKNVYLKDFLTYDDYVAEKQNALQLFDSTSTFGITYQQGNQEIRSDELNFVVKSKSDSEITLESTNNGKTIGFVYKMKADKYDIDYNIYFKGFTDAEVAAMTFTSDFKLLSTEKHLPTEQRIAAIFWKLEDEDFDYVQREDYELEGDIEWIAFSKSYFTAIVSNKNNFGKEGSNVDIVELDEEQTDYVKQYKADVNLGATAASNTVELNWYFGPTDYDILVEYENGTEDIVELGFGLFRWVNKYAIRPLFMWLLSLGMGVGISILLLTIVVKLILSPVNYKMYKSSAMMKVLKPEIEAITKKFPKKEDAMKKQQATMALYKETGVSPLAGCVPMLIQMPILFAIFRLFPASIELRQKGFLWAEDLSSYDSPILLGFEIPFYGAHVSIFTLLMAITTLLYTHYNSSNMQQPTAEGMPNMKYIMYFFPFMMIFFFNSYSSGLSYYYFISTLMTIGIMFAIKKFLIDDEKILAKIKANKANPKKKGKSKFQQRLEEAQKMQQEKQQRRNNKK
jgi:YidC/Oxa1 family membrane protein insertase